MYQRHKKKPDTLLVEKLAACGCTIEEIACQLNCSSPTVYRNYMSAIEKGRLQRNIAVRQAQFHMAMNDNPTMLIWLGKQWLGQKDKQEVEGIGNKDLGLNGVPIPAEFRGTTVGNKPN